MSEPRKETLAEGVEVWLGDCAAVIKTLPDNSIDSVVTDPPYALVSITKRFGNENPEDVERNFVARKTDGQGCSPYQRAARGFMGKKWDTGEVAFAVDFWAEILRVLKPGGHVVAFGGTRSYHRLACAIEDAGFEIRDCLFWCYGTGFPKSHDVSKGIDKAAGAEREVVGRKEGRGATPRGDMRGGRLMDHAGTIDTSAITAPATDAARQWDGWGTALKPAVEPIVLARKPLSGGTVAANVLRWGTGAINVDACRIAASDGYTENAVTQGVSTARTSFDPRDERSTFAPSALGRWPANLCHDGSDEVLALFPETKSGLLKAGTIRNSENKVYGKGMAAAGIAATTYDTGGDSGSAARFFFSAKADSDDRIGSKHPTVKPVDLMRWLCRLITPPGGTILDPFAGSGTTGEAAFHEGFSAVLIEREAEYVADIERRMAHVREPARVRKQTIVKARGQVDDAGPLFGALAL